LKTSNVNFERDSLAGKIPVTLITGFLGSGKTTLISRLVKHPDMRRVAVVINEIGEIGIDHDLVTMSSENITLLANGCICCSVRTDMQETLRELFAQRRAGLMVDFDRVVIETTGLADPAPVVQTLVSDTLLAAQYRLDGVVTLVDALHGLHQIDHQPEAVKQIALADRIFITKSEWGGLARLRCRGGCRPCADTQSGHLCHQSPCRCVVDRQWPGSAHSTDPFGPGQCACQRGNTQFFG
jgi:Ni2+-binding GTPase involved in maturation of urease and hydrogenase